MVSPAGITGSAALTIATASSAIAAVARAAPIPRGSSITGSPAAASAVAVTRPGYAVNAQVLAAIPGDAAAKAAGDVRPTRGAGRVCRTVPVLPCLQPS
jgi:hypothetical protein